MKMSNLFLKYIIGYGNPKRYWNQRWKLEKPSLGMKKLELEIFRFMEETWCRNVLDVGCGVGVLRHLPGYLGLDFSLEILKQSGMKYFVYADFAKVIPFPSNSFDCVVAANVLIHVPPDLIENAVAEIARVASKSIFVVHPDNFPMFVQKQPHCFDYDIKKLFSPFEDLQLRVTSGDSQ